jgi:predicted RNA-binding Zn-ribbon protein involved in translation (DUF1610 family)
VGERGFVFCGADITIFSMLTSQARHIPTVTDEADGVLSVMTSTKMFMKAREGYLGGPPCPKCGSLIIAAEASEFMSNEQIHHKWSCDECGYEFHTLVGLSAGIKSSGSQTLS